jgi:flagellar protein FlgJ
MMLTAPGLPAQQLGAAAAAALRSGGDAAKMREAALEFESVFMTTMLSSMFEGVQAEAPFGGGHAEEQYRGLLVAEYGKELASQGGVGLADQVFRELLAAQESAR